MSIRLKTLGKAIALCAIASYFQARAATSIGVNFQGRDGSTAGTAASNPGTPPLNTSETAGVVPQGNWNNVDDAHDYTPVENGTTPALVDSTGAATPVTLTFAANDSWYNDVDPAT